LRYADLIRAISATDILEAAKHYLNPDSLAIATAGTFED
jgi:predicted Zn-dependent peptidase